EGVYDAGSGETFPISMKSGVELRRIDSSTRPLIMGDGSNSVLVASGVVSATLDGLQISGGAGASSGGGLRIGGASNLSILNCKISGNSATTGGGIRLSGSSTLRVRDSTISENQASGGGGISV